MLVRARSNLPVSTFPMDHYFRALPYLYLIPAWLEPFVVTLSLGI